MMAAEMGIGRGLGKSKRPDLPLLCHPGMVSSRRLKLHMPVRMTLPCHSSLRSVEATETKPDRSPKAGVLALALSGECR